ncbi:MAG: hypothetical protein HRU15_19670 [Planctomycetes bacterium]|nr:hypothetical protein [Planctomycetota bacterium]
MRIVSFFLLFIGVAMCLGGVAGLMVGAKSGIVRLIVGAVIILVASKMGVKKEKGTE